MNFIRPILIIFLFPFILFCESDSNKDTTEQFNTINSTLGISFPPVANQEHRLFSTPLLNELKVKHIRIGEQWRFREPT